MQTWKSLIQAGDDSFQNTDYEQAERQYIQACERVEKLFPHCLDAEEAVTATLESYQRLADCLKRRGRYAIALEVLQKVHHLFGERLKTPDRNPIRREALMRGYRRALVPLMAFTRVMNLTGEEVFIREPRASTKPATVEKYANHKGPMRPI